MVQTIDGRALLPPAPLLLTLAALDGLGDDERLVLLLNCRPRPLYAILRRRGFAWRELPAGPGEFEIHISRAHGPPGCGGPGG